ncbi:zinc ribbon domain-containing protein [Streptomyces sp. CoH27]|uniref:RNA-guided endonuclease InsQ/TnpB family protein n=1 Tax=Streptomyces sp. CoH27 TaxID=2875763 RepID=UPI001CD1EACA|nr:zinc ribbon domain-containing protein [Streptomyces sp. CoH27]
MGQGVGGEHLRVLTAVVPVWLNRANHERAHEACHTSALLWNRTLAWVRDEWKTGRSPGREDIRRYVTSLPAEVRPIHAHTAQAVAYDLADAIALARTNKAQGIAGAKLPWREKKYRPLVFTARFGWKVRDGDRLLLSLGRLRERIVLPVPEFTDRSGHLVTPERWGEMKLCWSSVARSWALHISYRAVDDSLPGIGSPEAPEPGAVSVHAVTVAVDEGVINPMTLAALGADGAYEVLVINGRGARAAKQARNKGMARLQSKMSRCRTGSRRHRKLAEAKRKLRAKTTRRLRDFNHQVTAKANRFIREQVAAHERTTADGTDVVVRLVVGDVRGVERNTEKRRRASRSTRQQLSQWERGTQERQLAYKTGLPIQYVSEANSSQTCPFCLHRRKVRGRRYVCANKACALVLHRDAVGGVNIHTLAVNDGTFLPVPPGTDIRVKYLRAQPGWSPGQRERHGFHQHAQARAGASRWREARSSALNRATYTDAVSDAGVAAVPKGKPR